MTEDKNFQSNIRGSFFSQQTLLLIEEEDRKNQTFGFLSSRIQLLSLVKWTCICSSGGKTVITKEDHNEIGEMLLLAADLVDEDGEFDWVPDNNFIESPSKTLMKMISRLLIENTESFIPSFARWQLILFRYMPPYVANGSRSRGDTIIQSLLFKRLGVPAPDFVVLCFMLYVINAGYKSEDFLKRQPGLPIAEFEQALDWTSERTEATVTSLTLSIERMSIEILRTQMLPFSTDLSAFKRYPVLRIGQEMINIDHSLLSQACGEQLLIRLQEAGGKKYFGRIREAFGRALEEYTVDLLSSASGRYSGRIKKLEKVNKKNADVLITEGRARLVIEVTAASFEDLHRFSDNPDHLAVALERLDSEYEQIAYSIIDLLASDESVLRAIPVLIGMDKTISVVGIQKSLAERFEVALLKATKGKRPSHIQVPRLIVLSIEDVEKASGLVKDGRSYRDLLEAVLADDPQGFTSAGSVWAGRGYSPYSMPPLADSFIDDFQLKVAEQFRLKG